MYTGSAPQKPMSKEEEEKEKKAGGRVRTHRVNIQKGGKEGRESLFDAQGFERKRLYPTGKD